MARCDHVDCDGDARLRYSCRRCTGSFCPDHRLPENHDCASLRDEFAPSTSTSASKTDPDEYLIHGYVAVFAAIAVAVGVAFLLATSAPTLAVPSFDADIDLPSGGAANTTAAPTSTPAPAGSQGYNRSEVERIFIALLNEERQSRGLQPVSQRDVLTEMGESHSRNMAEYDYIGHEEPDGTTIEDRYRARGLLPECRLPVENSREYYPGAENAAHYWVDAEVETAEGPLYVDSERDLARGLFRGWMNSEGHREAMLVASADETGLGIWIDETGKVYASLELC